MSANPQINLALKKCESINLKKMKSDTLLMVVAHLLKEFEEIKANDETDSVIMTSNDAHFINNETQKRTINILFQFFLQN